MKWTDLIIYIFLNDNSLITCCSNLLCFSSLSLLSRSSLSLLSLSLSLCSRSLSSRSLCSSIGSGLIVQGPGGGKPGKVGGNALTLGGKLGTVLCNLLQGSCRGPKGKSLEVENGDTANGEPLGLKPAAYLVNGEIVLPVQKKKNYVK